MDTPTGKPNNLFELVPCNKASDKICNQYGKDVCCALTSVKGLNGYEIDINGYFCINRTIIESVNGKSSNDI